MNKTSADQPNWNSSHSKSWELLQRVNETATQLQNYWLTFLTFGAFLVAAVSGVRHHHLFLGAPIKLPILAVELPMLPFFMFTPILFLLFHTFVLTKYRFLVVSFEEFRSSIVNDRDLELTAVHPMEKHFSTSIILQALTRSTPLGGYADSVLTPLLTITLAILPVLVLLLTMIVFLPYQNSYATISHGLVGAADGLVAFYFLIYLKDDRRWSWQSLAAGFCATFFVTLSLLAVAKREQITVEGRWLSSWLLDYTRLSPIHRDFVDDRKLFEQNGRTGIKLRHRNFVGANFDYADLRGIDFGQSDLSYASFERARLENVNFWGSKLVLADFRQADLTGGSMNEATFHGADFAKAQLEGATARGGQFHGANLTAVHLDGADLRKAFFYGANLRNARLIGTNAKQAKFNGAYIGAATFLAADLKGADFSGARFGYGDLERAAGVENRLTHEKPRDLFYCKSDIFWHGKEQLKLPKYNEILADAIPSFDGANLERVVWREGSRSEPGHCKNIKDELPNLKFRNSGLCQNDINVLRRLGCLDKVVKEMSVPEYLIPQPVPQAKVKEKLYDHICFAGTFPKTATGIIHGGRGSLIGQVAAQVIIGRCSKACPGAVDLDPHTVGHLWRFGYDWVETNKQSLRFGPYEIPTSLVNCTAGKEQFWVRETHNFIEK